MFTMWGEQAMKTFYFLRGIDYDISDMDNFVKLGKNMSYTA